MVWEGDGDSYSDVVDPDQIGAVERYCITAPNEFRIEVGNSNVLDNDIRRSATEAETFAFDGP